MQSSAVFTSSDASNHGDPPGFPPEGVGVGLYRSQLWSPFRDFRGSLHKAKLEVAEDFESILRKNMLLLSGNY